MTDPTGLDLDALRLAKRIDALRESRELNIAHPTPSGSHWITWSSLALDVIDGLLATIRGRDEELQRLRDAYDEQKIDLWRVRDERNTAQARVAELEAALQRVNEQAGEAFHTAFRKGTDGRGSAEVWHAIKAMDPKAWDEAIGWALWAMGVTDTLAGQPAGAKD